MKRSIERTNFYRELRRQGFTRDYSTEELAQYGKEFPGNVRVDVQIWEDGSHRVSNAHSGLGDSRPSGFSTITGMLKAIEFESTRFARGVDIHLSQNFDELGS